MNAIIDTRSFGVCRRKYNTLDAVPADTLVEFACKIYALCSLTWDYINTILDLCIELKVAETKPLVRRIRDPKREYDRFRGSSLSSYDVKKEAERGAQIEEYLQKDFDKLFYSLYNDVSRLKLTDGHRRLVIAVQQTMTLMDAVKIYAKDCDRVIESYGTPPHSVQHRAEGVSCALSLDSSIRRRLLRLRHIGKKDNGRDNRTGIERMRGAKQRQSTMTTAIMELNEYQKQALSTAIYPHDRNITYLALALCGEAGEVAEKVKKIIRDKKGQFYAPDLAAIALEIGDVLWYAANLAKAIGYDLNSVAELNLTKIENRIEHNTLHGSGDDR